MTRTNGSSKRPVKTGTCDLCKTEHAVERGKLVEHTRVIGSESFINLGPMGSIGSGYPGGGVPRERKLTQRCEGSGSVPREAREKARLRNRAKRRAVIDVVRGDASVLLDAILHKRADLDAEMDRDRLLALAFAKYRLDYKRARVQGGLLWVSRHKTHEIFCRFCGFLVAKIQHGGWTPMPIEQRDQIVGRHILICALQYLTGIRIPPEPGAKMYPQLAPSALFDETTRDPTLPLPYLIQCPACGAVIGAACIDYERDKATTTVVWSEALQLEHPHEARRISAESGSGIQLGLQLAKA